ncbi:hypothetical protein QFZ41_003670 [Luteibacter sp. W1I16]|uniref:hypothetical protein n=1 Tax=Luteibacter sp. W1I16 TaxID=3373922 RepID=UPI003D25065D
MVTEEGKKKQAALQAEIAKRVAGYKREQEQLLGELASVGVHIDMVNRLPMVPTKDYVQAIPILARHLRKTYSEATLESLARTLATQEAKQYWDELVEMYRSNRNRVREGSGDFTMGLAAAVAAACPPGRLDELIELVRDTELPHRVLLLTPLRKRRGKDPKIAQLIDELRHDPALAKEINSWKILSKQATSRTH